MIITDLANKIKRLREPFLIHEEAIWVLLLVIVISFFGLGLWRLVPLTLLDFSSPIIIERGVDFATRYQSEQYGKNLAKSSSPNNSLTSEPTSLSETLVASKNGSKYYFEDCVGLKRIKEENKIYFSNEAEAVAQGYTKAANCH